MSSTGTGNAPGFADRLGFGGPRNPNPAPGEMTFTLFGYAPSMAFGVVGVVVFGLAGLLNLYYCFRRPRRYRLFHAMVTCGALGEMAGYVCRSIASNNPFTIAPFSAQFMLIMLAPIFLTVGVDLLLNIMVSEFDDVQSLLLLPPRKMLAIFVTTDGICILIQAAGGGIFGAASSSTNPDGTSSIDPMLGSNVLLAGLACQIVAWVIFLVFVFVAIHRARNPVRAPHIAERRYDPLRWLLYTTVAASVLLLWRACFRTAEAAEGFLAGDLTREYLFAINEFLPIALTVILLTALPPWRFVLHKRTQEGGGSVRGTRGEEKYEMATPAGTTSASESPTPMLTPEDRSAQGRV